VALFEEHPGGDFFRSGLELVVYITPLSFGRRSTAMEMNRRRDTELQRRRSSRRPSAPHAAEHSRARRRSE